MKKLLSLVVLLSIVFSTSVFATGDDDDEQSTLWLHWSPISLMAKSKFKDYVEVKNLELWEENNTFDYNEFKYKFTYGDTKWGVKYVKSYDIEIGESTDGKCYVKVETDMMTENNILFLVPPGFKIGRLTFGWENN